MSGRAAVAAIALTGAGYIWWKQTQQAGQIATGPAPLDPSTWLEQQAGGSIAKFNEWQASTAPQTATQGGQMGFNFIPLFQWGVDRLSSLFGGATRPANQPEGATATPPLLAPATAIATTTGASAGTGPGGADFGATERRYRLPSGYLHRTAEIESGLNPMAQNPRSSAGGLFQFINSTARQYGLTNRFDPVAATDAAGRLARDNAAHLRRVLGREPTGAELYLAHQQGAGGAARLLRDPSARAVDVVGSDAVRLNGGGDNMTAGQFAGLWINKYNRGVFV